MKFRLDANGAYGSGGGIGNMFKALAMGDGVRQDAADMAALRSAQTYAHTMAGNEHGAKATGLQMTNDARLSPVDESLTPEQKMMKFVFNQTGDTNALNLAKSAGEFQAQEFKRNAAESMHNPHVYNMFNTLTKNGATYMPFDKVGNTGVSLDKATGNQIVAERGLNAMFNNVQRSIANENNAQAGNAAASAALHRAQIPEVQARTELTRSKIGQPQVVVGPDGVPVVVPGGAQAKPIPVGALKMQQEELDEIGNASGINSQLSRFYNDISNGSLELGPLQNLISSGRNLAGVSNDNSRNYASYQAMLEKARNDSLRLNKGVQTEGDAQRAWNELVRSSNDPQVVLQRLAEIQKLNDRAIELRRSNIQTIRSNYGLPNLDTSAYAPGRQQASSMSESDRFQSVANAKKAIAAGYDKAAVLQRLEDSGITNHGIK